MKKMFLSVENERFNNDVELILTMKGIKFKKVGIAEYDIWTDMETKKELNKFSFMAVINFVSIDDLDKYEA